MEYTVTHITRPTIHKDLAYQDTFDEGLGGEGKLAHNRELDKEQAAKERVEERTAVVGMAEERIAEEDLVEAVRPAEEAVREL